MYKYFEGLGLLRNRVVRLIDCPVMTVAGYHGHKATSLM